MATITLDFDPPDLPVSVTLTALRRADTDAAVALPTPATFTDAGDGTWLITFTEPAAGLAYAYEALATWDDGTTTPFAGTQEGAAAAPVVTETVADAIADNAKGPKRASGDQGSMEQHSLAEQIEADKYLSAKSATRAGGFGGLQFVQFVPPGAE